MTSNATASSSSFTVIGTVRDGSCRELASSKGDVLENIVRNTGDAAQSTCEATRYWARGGSVSSVGASELQISRITSPSGANVLRRGVLISEGVGVDSGMRREVPMDDEWEGGKVLRIQSGFPPRFCTNI